MAPATNERPQGTFREREGDALLYMGGTAAIQLALVIGVLFYMSTRAEHDMVSASPPILRPSIIPSAF
jgi:hypothetical protein